MRSTTGGARRESATDRAEDGKAISGGANRSKKQQLALCGDALAQAAAYDTKRLFKRGKDGVQKLRKQRRNEYCASNQKLDAVKVENLRATNMHAEKRRRADAPTLQACRVQVAQLAEPFAKVKRTRGNPFKDKAKIAAGKAKLKTRLDEYKQRRANGATHRKRPMTEREKRQREVCTSNIRVTVKTNSLV